MHSSYILVQLQDVVVVFCLFENYGCYVVIFNFNCLIRRSCVIIISSSDIAVEWQVCFKVASLLLYPDGG